MSNPISDFLNKKKERANKYHDILEEMLNSGRYLYAERTLADIWSFIEENGTITDAQVQAIENIREKPNERNW